MNRRELVDKREEDPTDPLVEVMVEVESEPFRRFSDRLDVELEKLVAQWQHTAAPAAGQSGRARIGKLKVR